MLNEEVDEEKGGEGEKGRRKTIRKLRVGDGEIKVGERERSKNKG